MADTQKDPLVSAWFGLEFQGQVAGAFRECTGLGSENEVVEYKASGPKGEQVIKKVPGRLKWNNITLKRGITDSMDMWKWRKLVEEGKMTEARKNGTVTMFNQKGDAVAKWDFVNAWPSKLSGPGANAANNEVAVEELELAHEGYERTQ
jgi:phage tail-like protein